MVNKTAFMVKCKAFILAKLYLPLNPNEITTENHQYYCQTQLASFACRVGSSAWAGTVLDFDGTGDYVITASDVPDSDDTWTVSAWVKIDAFPAEGSGDLMAIAGSADLGTSATSYDSIIGVDEDGYLKGYYYDGTMRWTTATTALSTGSWYHVVYVGDSDNDTQKLYLNGVEVGSSTYTNASNGATKFAIAFTTLHGTFESRFDGKIDEVAYYNTALSSSNIESLFNSGTPASASSIGSGLLAYYKMDTNSGSTAVDSEDNGTDYDGTITDASWTTDTVAADSTAPTISSFTSTTSDGSFKEGDTINITANTDEAIQSGNTLTVTLDTTDTVLLTAASAGATLVGTYTVGAGDTSADLTISSFTIGTVADTAGNAMTNTTVPSGASNLGGSSALVIDTGTPSIIFSPLNSATDIAVDSNITLTFNEAIRKASDDSEITNSTVDDLITLKLTNSSGATIAFDATINAGKTIITINPTSDFTGEQVIYVAIDATVEDAADNAISAASATFTVVTTALPSPLNKTNVTASIKAMSGVAIDAVAMNFNAVEHRVSWLNANVGSNKLSHQGVRLNFANPTVNKLMNTAYVKPGKLDLSNEFVKLIRNNIKDGEVPEATAITDDTKQGLSSVGFNEFAKVREDTIGKVLNATSSSVMGDWNIWTEGRITVGKTYKTDTSSEQDSQTQNLSLGFDRIIKDNNPDVNPNSSGHIIGVVLGIGKSDADTTNNSTVDADSYSLSAYGVIRQDDKALAQAMMGYGHIKVDKTRIDGSDTLTGAHDANQFFTSIKVQKETIGVGSFSLSPYGKIHASRTWYDGYSETGGNTALTYGEQTIDSTVLSVGLDVDYLIPIHKGNIRPFMQYEYGADVSGSSTVVMHYNNEATNYQLELDNKADSNWKFVLGSDFYTKDEWDSSISYERTEAVNAGYSDSLAVKVGLRF